MCVMCRRRKRVSPRLRLQIRRWKVDEAFRFVASFLMVIVCIAVYSSRTLELFRHQTEREF